MEFYGFLHNKAKFPIKEQSGAFLFTEKPGIKCTTFLVNKKKPLRE